MARSDMRGGEAAQAPEGGISPEVESQAAELVGAHTKDEERPGRRFGSSRVLSAADRDRILKESRDVDFPAAMRGYDRAAVDRYVERVSRLITELEMSSSPEAAVRHALDEVTEETREILQHAHQTAEDITARSRGKADDRLRQAEREGQEIREEAQRQAAETREAATHESAQLREIAARESGELRETTQREVSELREAAVRESADLREAAAREAAETREAAIRESQQMRTSAQREADDLRGTARRDTEEMLESAETRARELAVSAEAIWRERRRLIEDMRAVGEQLVAIGEAESKRFPRFGEEGSAVAELLRDPGVPVAPGVPPDQAGAGEQSNGSAEVVPG
jgi:DivIVA domain-containing protein